MSENMTVTVERVHADHVVAKKLGDWTSAGVVEVRARRGSVVVDLRSTRLPAEVEVRVEAQRSVVKLLVPEGAEIERWDLRWTGKGSLKDSGGVSGAVSGGVGDGAARRIRLVGGVEDGEIRVQRGGVAVLTAMCSREYLDDLRRAHKEGRLPVVADPDPRAVSA